MEAQARPQADAAQAFAPGLPAEIAFLAAHGITPRRLQEAAGLAARIGVSPSQQVLASGLVSEDLFYRALASELQLGFRSHSPQLRPGGKIAANLREGLAIAGFRPDSRFRFVVAPPAGPALRRFLAAGHDGRDDVVVVTPSALASELRRANARPIAREAAWLDQAGLSRFSARTGTNWFQKALAFLLVGALSILGTLAPVVTLIGLALALGPLFFGTVILRLAAMMEKPPADLWHEHRWQVDDSRLPIYTVAVPLLGEEAVLDQLIDALSAIDYPAAKLDIRILVEEADWSLRRAFSMRELPPFMQVMIVPRGIPQTKPRALNLALAEARGELFTIYDAEDIPDPRQLRLAAARFLRSESELVCLQARLVIDNTEDGWIASCFALEYAGLFDVLNPGLLQSGLPILLGGTSNHFRTSALRHIGGWDPWNVTEDADVGFRLMRAGGYMADLPSATLEEAPATLRAWLRQRTRWHKGYLQTLISHLQAPRHLLREAGFAASMTLLALLSGTLLGMLGYPFFIAAAVAAWLEGSLFAAAQPVDALFSALALVLTVSGTCVVFVLPALGVWRRGAVGLWRWLPLLPVYHLFGSLAAWLALYEYVDDRFAWNKTTHGLARSSRYRDQMQSVTDAAATPGPLPPAGARY
jgi:glycosyltransferase XagB